MNEIDVLIVGAGPTGLVMAIECRRYCLSFRIIDKSFSPSTYSKAAAVQDEH
jgi:thioredoxin reductase